MQKKQKSYTKFLISILGSLTFVMGLVPGLAFAQGVPGDRDNDGLADSWEIANSSIGVNPNRADLILVAVIRPNMVRGEVLPTLENVVRFFARVPNRNLDGSTGIRVHIQWGNNLPASDSDAPPRSPTPYTEIRTRAMPGWLVGKGHGVLIGSGTGGGGQTSGADWSGCSNNWHTIVHEVGHQLGLDHEPKGTGIPSPLYTSLMNYDYSYQFNGDANAVHFSTGKFSSVRLNERSLNETLAFPIADLMFLSRAPYFFTLRSASPTSTHVDFNRNGVFGEIGQMADINGGASLTPRDQVNFVETVGGFSLSTLGGRLVSIFSDLPQSLNINWSQYDEPGLSTRIPGQLRYQVRDARGVLHPPSPRPLVSSGVTGDPHTVEAFGKLILTYPTATGYALLSLDPGRTEGTLQLRGLAADANSPSSQPILVRTLAPEQLYLFVWNQSTKRITSRRVNVAANGALQLDPVVELKMGLGASAVSMVSGSPIGGTWDSKLERIALVTTERSGGREGRMKLTRFGRIGTGWYGQTSQWVGGDAVRATLDRPTVLFDGRPSAGAYGQYLIFGRWEEPSGMPTLIELIRLIRTTTGTVWTAQIMGNVWTQTRTASSATLYGDDVAWGWRPFEGFPGMPNRQITFMRASGITDSGITDYNDVKWITEQGLRTSLEGIRR